MLDDSAAAVHQDYRRFVGGNGVLWDRIADLQFEFIRDRGLTPHDKLIDVGCGALRGGSRFIRYLAPDRYYGIDKHIELIIYGVEREIGIEVFREKMPHFAISDCFEFEKMGTGFTFGIAQSLFTHLAAKDILACLMNLQSVVAPQCRFYATFFEARAVYENPVASHSHAMFQYTRAQLELLGSLSGWSTNYIGDWRHPRGQMMMEFVRTA